MVDCHGVRCSEASPPRASLRCLPRGCARAQSAAMPTRLLVVHVPEGMWNGATRPRSGGTNLGPIFEALAALPGKINVLNNLDMQSRDHGPGGDGHHRGVPHMFTGTEMRTRTTPAARRSIKRSRKRSADSRSSASLQLAVRIVYGDTNSRLIWSGPQPRGACQTEIRGGVQRAFSKTSCRAVPTMPPAPKVDLQEAARSTTRSRSGTLRPELATSDRERLDSYQESLREIERRLGTTSRRAFGARRRCSAARST